MTSSESKITTTDKIAEWRALAVMAVAALAIVALLGVMAWLGMRQVSPDAARAWALIATLLLPVAGLVCYRLGSRNVARADAKAEGMLEGIKTGVGEVMNAASQTADLRVNTVREVRRIEERQPAGYIVQPPPETIIVDGSRQLNGGQKLYLE